MLARVANHLYWMGRYLERTDHLARYINVQYFSSLDSPNPKLHKLALTSIIDMTGMPEQEESEIYDENVLVKAALDDENPASILSSLFAGRENARSVRETISNELWEAINSYYHYVANYPVDVYKTRGLYDFTTNAMQHYSNVRGRIMFTLLQDVGWQFIQMGLYLERSAQIVRIMISKLSDIEEIKQYKLGASMETQQWNTLLDCLEAKDMCRRHYSGGPDKQTTLDFLLFNAYFPKSVTNNLRELLKCLRKVKNHPTHDKNSITYKIGKILAPYQYTQVDEIEDNLIEYLEHLLSDIYKIHDLITEEYFN